MAATTRRRTLRCEMTGEGPRRRDRKSSVVHRKVRELQRLVPGGSKLRAEQLFVLTADYISHLRMQVDVLKALSNMYIPQDL